MDHLSGAAKAAGSCTSASVFGAAVGAGLVGGLMMIALDPPKSKRQMFGQALVACISSAMFGPIAVRVADHYLPWIDLANADALTAIEVSGPVFFVIGSLSWGLAGAAVHLRHIIADRGADVVADKIGLKQDEPPK